MILDLREIFSAAKKVLEIDTLVDLSDYENGGIYPIADKVHFVGRITNSADVVTLNGTAEFDYTAPCDRCAVSVTKHFKMDFSHVLVHELVGEDFDEFVVAENMQLDLNELIKTDIILNLPFKFLCKDDCKGICAGCGKNLNNESCECKKEVDPRLAKLDEFFE